MFGKKQNEGELEYFTIYDTKVGVYRDPVLAINQHDLMRQVSGLMLDPAQKQNPLVQNSEDFQVFRVGTYNRRTGCITPEKPQHIANLHEVKAAALNAVQDRGH